MIDSRQHIQPKASDYVLGLLLPDERRSVEQHAQQCAACDDALRDELRLSQAVRTTLQTATHVTNGRLQSLMPAVPSAKPRRWALPVQRQLASVCVLLILFLGGVGLFQNSSQSTPAAAPTLLAATATNTNVPTHTAVMTQAAIVPTSTAVVIEPPIEASVPPPAATPVAAAHASSN